LRVVFWLSGAIFLFIFLHFLFVCVRLLLLIPKYILPVFLCPSFYSLRFELWDARNLLFLFFPWCFSYYYYLRVFFFFLHFPSADFGRAIVVGEGIEDRVFA
jgi:hypothetical protein